MATVLMQGNQAVAEGAIAAGARFFGGYPITPSTEIAELMAKRLPQVGGKFIQMEDEIASIGAIIGASIAGKKVLTATSGPGFSLKQELLGYAAIAEIPIVIANVQRVGPSTGQPTSPSQGDIMQARWGTHGDHPIIALTPASVPECFTLTIRAYELSEKYRVPVIMLLDEIIGHMREKIELPENYDAITQPQRKQPAEKPSPLFQAYQADNDKICPMPPFGEGYRFHITGLIHDDSGFPNGSPEATQSQMDRLNEKLSDNLSDIVTYEEYRLEDADYAVVAFGGTARTAYAAVDEARSQGIKVGLFRPITIWPFAQKQIEQLATRVKKILVAELNCGQYVGEIQKAVNGKIPVVSYTKYNNEAITPAELSSALVKLTREVE